MGLFKNKKTENDKSLPNIPDGILVKCNYCKKAIYKKIIDTNRICPECNGYFRLNAKERIKLIVDKNSFIEMDADLHPKNPLNYPNYEKIIDKAQKKSGITEAVVTGIASINDNKMLIAAMDSNFMMGSMGSVVGEKITRLFEYACQEKLPVLIFTASGGARMQEGIISLMQMAKISAAVKKHDKEGLLYISVLTDPTTGGVSASFAMLADIILAEPKALIGFAGKRVIEQTIKEKLPEDFQTSEFLLEHGFIDKIIKREDLKEYLGNILSIHKQVKN